MTELVEFKNHKGETLRGLVDKARGKRGIVFLHGFEKTTIEAKFKNIVDKFKGRVNLFRFDFSGCGLSDGKFEDLTIEKLKKELERAVRAFKRARPGIEEVNLVAHSLGCCVVLKFISENPQKIGKAVFLSPAFCQKELLRYWFTKIETKKEGVEVDWSNFKKYFSEGKFQKDIKKKRRMAGEHTLSNRYFLENKKLDYQELFEKLDFDLKDILIIYGTNDDKVPFESNDKLPQGIRTIKVFDGDHDLQRPDMAKQYLKKIIGFLGR